MKIEDYESELWIDAFQAAVCFICCPLIYLSYRLCLYVCCMAYMYTATRLRRVIACGRLIFFS